MCCQVQDCCDEPITRPEESYRLWCVSVCDLETSRMRRPWPVLGCCATKEVKFSPWVEYLGMRDSGGTDSSTFITDTGWIWVTSFIDSAAVHAEKCLLVPTDQEAGWAPGPIWILWRGGESCYVKSLTTIPRLSSVTVFLTAGYLQHK
jgi:hypothetical protein